MSASSSATSVMHRMPKGELLPFFSLNKICSSSLLLKAGKGQENSIKFSDEFELFKVRLFIMEKGSSAGA